MNIELPSTDITKEVPKASANTYADLINEAFLMPIRNVAVIDDEYPTLSAFLGGTLSKEQNKPENQERLQQIISMCHDKYRWSVDVYDGKNPTLGSGKHGYNEHINHSDLIILDYHLDGDPSLDNGERARSLINHLANNNHFNLVVINTKGHDGDIENVFTDILKEFLRLKDFVFELDNAISEIIDDYIETQDPERSEFTSFYSKFSLIDVAKQLGEPKPFSLRNPSHIFNPAKGEIERIAKDTKLDEIDVIKYKFNQLLHDLFDDKIGNENISISWDYEGKVNYISSGRVFLTVTSKEDMKDANDLCESLQLALLHHDASPMMLLMTKMRSEIDDRGLEFASQIIDNRYAQAGWLYNLLEKAKENPNEHSHAIDLHWEQFAAASKKELIQFSRRLVESLQETGDSNKDIVKRYFKDCIGDSISSTAHLNIYSCSRPPTTSHLTTGTILKCTYGKYWICLTPACDLVPDQATERWKDRLGDDHIAFQTIQLIEDGSNLSTALDKVNENEFIFLKIDKDIKHFRFSKKRIPLWETFYAANRGEFSSNADGYDYINVKTFRHINHVLSSVDLKMEVISELRYEYALNLLHKFGSNQTRIGLNFVKTLW